MTCQSPTDNHLLALLNAKVVALATRLFDEALAKQEPATRLRIELYVEHVLDELRGQLVAKPREAALKPREAYLDPENEDEGPQGPRFPGYVDRYSVSELEPEENGVCSDCGHSVLAHHPRCEILLAASVDESMCGECGRGDYDHTFSCSVGREQDREDAARYAAGIDDADAFCARHCKGRGRKGHHLLCQFGAIEDEEILAKHLGKSPFSELGKAIRAFERGEVADAAPSEMEADQ